MMVRRVAREYMRELRAQTGRTACLGVLGGTEVANIDRCQGSRQGQYAVDAGIGVGTRLPLYCTAAGKALLARLPAAEQQDLIAKVSLAQRAPKAITIDSVLRVELERILAEGGIAVMDEELFDGRRAVAAVVLDAEGPASRDCRAGRSSGGVHPERVTGATWLESRQHGSKNWFGLE
jgi:DNA-binding IclR family transcriptional regulator